MTDERLPAVVAYMEEGEDVDASYNAIWMAKASPEHRAGSFESLAERLIKDAKHIRAGGTFERAKTH